MEKSRRKTSSSIVPKSFPIEPSAFDLKVLTSNIFEPNTT